MIRICVKSGIKQLPWFAEEEFSFSEAYLGRDDDPAELLATKMRLISIHLPTQVRVGNQTMAMNFNPSSPAVVASREKLVEILDFSKTNGVENIVLHLGCFNAFTEDRQSVIEQTARYFSALNCDQVKICLENVPCWLDLSFKNEPICSNVEHWLEFQKYYPGIGLALDIDHAAINAIFQPIYQKYKNEMTATTNRAALRREMGAAVDCFTRENVDHCSALANAAIQGFLEQINPTVIHATGSDFCHYRPHDRLPLIGEALPMGFSGLIESCAVQDRLDHEQWLGQLIDQGHDATLTMELLIRPDYDYVEQLQKNLSYLKKIIENKTKIACQQ